MYASLSLNELSRFSIIVHFIYFQVDRKTHSTELNYTMAFKVPSDRE